jgi:hypothetical protein
MQDGSIAGKVVSSMALLKAIRNIDACCYNNQEIMRWNLILGENLNFLIKQI